MYDKTARNTLKDGKKVCDYLRKRGMIAGIKVDKWIIFLEGIYYEIFTFRIEGLEQRCIEYNAMEIMFSKCRAALIIGVKLPTDLSIKDTAHSFARYR